MELDAADETPVVLVIDDETSVVRYLRAMLEADGLMVYEALNGPLGLNMVSVVDPNVVVLDVMMPGMNGVDVCAAIRAERPNLPVVILTAWEDHELEARCAAAGATAFLTKPLLPGQLPEALAEVVPDWAAPVRPELAGPSR